MDPISCCDIRLVFTLPPRDSTLQYKRCVHLWNNFPCIIALHSHFMTQYKDSKLCLLNWWKRQELQYYFFSNTQRGIMVNKSKESHSQQKAKQGGDTFLQMRYRATIKKWRDRINFIYYVLNHFKIKKFI